MGTDNISLDFLRNILKEEYPDVTIQHFEYAPATGPGDSFTSTIYRVFLFGTQKHLETDSEQPWQASIIWKQLPNHEVMRKAFRPVYITEFNFFQNVWPALNKFQRTLNLKSPFSSLPKCLFANDETVVLEDLKPEGYVMIDKSQGLTFEQCYMILKKLAHYHALSLAMKSKNPKMFYKLSDYIPEALFTKENHNMYQEFCLGMANEGISMMEQEFSGSEDKKIYLEKIRKFCSEDSYFDSLMKQIAAKEPLAVVTHGDCWVNNFMFKHEDDRIVDVYLIDFQQARYTSLAMDLVLVLYTCMERDLRGEHLPALLRHYSDTLHKRVVEMVGEDSMFLNNVDEDGLYELVQQELKRCVPFGFGMSLNLLPIMTMRSDEALAQSKQSNGDNASEKSLTVTSSSPECRRRLAELLIDIVDSGLL